jgi:putative redox protein
LEKKIRFKNRRNEQLTGHLDLPPGSGIRFYTLFAHCFTCSKDLTAIRNISITLSGMGVAVFRFDFTGLGESEGDFSDTNFTTNVEDLVDAADFLRTEYAAPALLIGHSLGGSAVLQAADLVPECRAVVTIGAPCRPDHIKNLIKSTSKQIETEGRAEVTLAGRKFVLKKQFLEDLEQTRMDKKIRNLKRALLILHSPADKIVGIDNARHIFDTALHPKSFISLDTADHLLTRKADSFYTGEMIACWANRYIPVAKPEKTEPKEVHVRTGQRGYYTEISSRGHSIIADEPADYGGTDRGPSPYEFLAGSLGACTSITLRMYADKKKWPLEDVDVYVKHNKIHAEDCEDCESDDSMIDILEKKIKMSGPLSEKQKNRLLEIAGHCPVHRTLTSEIKIRTTLME